MKTASEMTYTVSSGALNSTPTRARCGRLDWDSCPGSRVPSYVTVLLVVIVDVISVLFVVKVAESE